MPVAAATAEMSPAPIQSSADVRRLADALTLVTNEVLAEARRTTQFTRLQYKVSFGSDGGLSGQGTPRPDPAEAVRFMRVKIATMKSYGELADAVGAVGGFHVLFGRVLDSMPPRVEAANDPLLSAVILFVLAYLEDAPDASWNHERFNTIFARFMTDLSSSTVTHKITTYLTDLEVSSELRLSDVGTIRPITEGDIETLWERSAADFGPAFRDPKSSMGRSVLEISFELDHGNMFGMRGDLLDSHLHCLRLVCGSRGLFATAYEQITSPLYSLHPQTIWSADLPVLLRGTRPMIKLGDESLPTICACMTALSSSENRSSVEIALRRLASGGSRDRDEDSFLDYVIGIESLIGDSGDTGYRIALRLAVVIGVDPADRAAVFRSFKSIYKRRSNIAHGKAPSANPQQVTAAAAELRRLDAVVADYLRRLILRLLLEPAAVSKDTIDEAILRSAVL